MNIDISELHARASRLTARLARCDICPRKCGVNRLEERGISAIREHCLS